jgi:hypothetical protein
LTFSPFTSKTPDGVRQYDKEKSRQGKFILYADNAIAFASAIDKNIIPIIGTEKTATVAVYTESKQNELDTRKYLGLKYDGGNLILVFMDPQGNKINHTFGKREVYEDFDFESKTGGSVYIDSSFISFMSKIRNIDNMDGRIEHEIKLNKAKGALAKSNNGNNYNTQNANMGSAPYQPNVISSSSAGEFIPAF